MALDLVELVLIAFGIISAIVLGYLVFFSMHRLRITLLGFWRNVLVLSLLFVAAKMSLLFGETLLAFALFTIFSFLLMLLLLVTFVLNYSLDDHFDSRPWKVK